MDSSMDSHWIPTDPSMEAMDGYMLVHGIQWKDVSSVSPNIPQGLLFGFPLDSFEFLHWFR